MYRILYYVLLADSGLSILCHSSLPIGTSYGGESAHTARSESSCSRNPHCCKTVSFIDLYVLFRNYSFRVVVLKTD